MPASASSNELKRFYDPRPFNTDPTQVVPNLPDDVPLTVVPPTDAPAQNRPSDAANTATPTLRYFTRREFRVCRALVEAIIQPPDDRYLVTPAETAINIDRYLACSNSAMRMQIRAALLLLQLWPLMSLNLPFTWMSTAARRRWAKKFERNRGFVLTKLLKLKNLVYLNHYGDPRTNPYTGYTTPFERPAIAAATAEIRRRVRQQVWS